MGYLNPFIWNFNVISADAAAVLADNADLAGIVVDAGKEVTILDMKGYVTLASDTATDAIELVKEDNTILCLLLIGATGHVSGLASDKTTAASFPIRVAAQSATLPKLLKLRVDGATDATTTVFLQVKISGL